jgi:hypothetical protein
VAKDRDGNGLVTPGSGAPGVKGRDNDTVRRSGRHDGPVHPGSQRSVNQQDAENARTAASAARKGKEHRNRGFPGWLLTAMKWTWIIVVIAALLWVGGVAIWLGSQDVLWPVSLTAQVLGGFFVVAGLATLAGAVLVIVIPKLLFPPDPEYGKDQIAYIAAAALAGCFITLMIVVHSFRYEQLKALLYGVLALLCLALAVQTLPRAWPHITQTAKNIGITLAVLGGVASFWYQSFYLPESTEIGIQYGFSVVSVTSSGSDRLVTFDLTMENQSPVAAITLGSMVVVSGLTFPKKAIAVSSTAAQQNIDKYAQDLATPPAGVAPNPNIGSSGNPSSAILAVMRPVNNDSFMFPNDILSRDVTVVVPESNITALEIELYVLYARTTRLTLGTSFRPVVINVPFCAQDVQSSWFINQSALVRYTRGAQIFYSNWCASATDPFIGWGIQAAGGTADTRKQVNEIGNDIGIERASRNEIFVLPS